MFKFIRSKASTLIVAAIMVLFNVIFLVCVDFENSKASRWIGYGFINMAFIIALCLTLFVKARHGVLVDNFMPMFSYTSGYLFINLIANIIFMAVNAENVKPVIIVNLILLVFYIILFIVAASHVSRVSEVVEKREKQISNFDEITVKIYALKDMSSDEEIKAAIGKLSDRLRYSSSSSSQKSAKYEQRLDELADNITEMIAGGADKDEIIAMIKTADTVLTTRNHMVSMP